MGRSSTVYVKDSIRWYSGKSVQIENTLVCAGLFSISLRNDNVQEFDTKLDEILLSDGSLESLSNLKCTEDTDVQLTEIGNDGGQGDGFHKACRQQAAADPRGSRTCVCANTFSIGWHTQGWRAEKRPCRGTVLSAWLKPPDRRKEEEPGCPQGYMVATWYGDDSPHLSWSVK